MLWSCSEKSDQEVSLALRTPFFSRSVCVRREARVCGGRCSAAAGRMDRDGSWSLGGHYTRGRGGDVSFIYTNFSDCIRNRPSNWFLSSVIRPCGVSSSGMGWVRKRQGGGYRVSGLTCSWWSRPTLFCVRSGNQMSLRNRYSPAKRIQNCNQ